jgi:hypothetical protein
MYHSNDAKKIDEYYLKFPLMIDDRVKRSNDGIILSQDLQIVE